MQTPYLDDRLGGVCVLCGADPDTQEHVVPKVFLDGPHPENLPTVRTCDDCNGGASQDQEYVACLLEVAVCGTTEPAGLDRPKISRKLAEKASLRGRLEVAFDPEAVGVRAEVDRLARVLEKMGRSVWTFETGEPSFRSPRPSGPDRCTLWSPARGRPSRATPTTQSCQRWGAGC